MQFHIDSILRHLLVALLAVVMVGCASNDYPPASSVQDYDYIVGPGDNLEIFVWGNPELSTTAVVRPDGKFTTRLVEDLPASGMTSTQLARAIEDAYGKYVKSPVVSVIVKGFSGVPSQQVRVVGEASEPKSVPYRKHMTVLDLMIAVGGLNEFANGNKSVLVRYTDGGQQAYGLKLEDLLSGDISANTPLMPGDIVIIPEAWF